MAVINILAKSKKADWQEIFEDVGAMNLRMVEFFPIPRELGFDDDALVVNVQQGYADKRKVLAELSLLIQYLAKHNFTLTELYDGVAITGSNMLTILNRLLP